MRQGARQALANPKTSAWGCLEGFQDRLGEKPEGAGRREHCPERGALQAARPPQAPHGLLSTLSTPEASLMAQPSGTCAHTPARASSAHTGLASLPRPRRAVPSWVRVSPHVREGLALGASGAPGPWTPALPSSNASFKFSQSPASSLGSAPQGRGLSHPPVEGGGGEDTVGSSVIPACVASLEEDPAPPLL